MRFEVKFRNEIVGFSELEAGDAPMGVASGRLWTTAAYSSIQRHCIEHRERWVAIPELTISIAGGLPIECCGGVHITDFSPELGETGIEICVQGIPCPLYEELFPHHVEAYKKQFERK